jgi:hypothetical protein
VRLQNDNSIQTKSARLSGSGLKSRRRKAMIQPRNKSLNGFILSTIRRYLTIPQEHLEEADDEVVERPQISIRDVLEALGEETYSDGNPAIIIALAKYKKQLDERQRHLSRVRINQGVVCV